VIANGENAAHGYGITKFICDSLIAAGVDAITMGNHTFDQRDELSIFEQYQNLIRPLNYPRKTPGRGYAIFEMPQFGWKIMVVNLLGRVFMEPNEDPFTCMDILLEQHPLGQAVNVIFVDIHAEATSEKTALARYLDGRVTFVAGTHTHAPTADLQVLPHGTGFISDVGMCGDFNSVIGMQDEAPIKRFTSKVNAYAKMRPAEGEATVCGLVLDIAKSGLCKHIQTIRDGGSLLEQKNFSLSW
jgi:metallophosphoesterase (TIGR00282 family)